MKFTINFDIFEKLILRFVSKPPNWHGDIIFKYYNGKISFGEATDKIDLKATKDMYLTLTSLDKIKEDDDDDVERDRLDLDVEFSKNLNIFKSD